MSTRMCRRACFETKNAHESGEERRQNDMETGGMAESPRHRRPYFKKVCVSFPLLDTVSLGITFPGRFEDV